MVMKSQCWYRIAISAISPFIDRIAGFDYAWPVILYCVVPVKKLRFRITCFSGKLLLLVQSDEQRKINFYPLSFIDSFIPMPTKCDVGTAVNSDVDSILIVFAVHMVPVNQFSRHF